MSICKTRSVLSMCCLQPLTNEQMTQNESMLRGLITRPCLALCLLLTHGLMMQNESTLVHARVVMQPRRLMHPPVNSILAGDEKW